MDANHLAGSLLVKELRFLDEALIQHGIRHLDEPGDIRAVHQVSGMPYFSAVSNAFLWMAIMMLCNRSSTSFASRRAACCSGHLEARGRDAAGVGGLCRPVEDFRFQEQFRVRPVCSACSRLPPQRLHPFMTSVAASLALISFCVALGKAQSALIAHSGLKSFEGSTGIYLADLK